MGTGFGLIPWGTGPWGSVVPLTITGAVATSRRSVLVQCSCNLLAESVLGRGDSLNPRTWRVVDPSGTQRSVLAVSQPQPDQAELYMLRTLGEWHDIFVLSASELISSAGVPILPGVSVTFRGVALSTTILRQIGPHDLLSREVEGDEEVGGLLTTTPAGGYGQQSGVDLYKKLYTRRLTSDPNSYFHLTGYGLGLRPKELIRANDLLSLQRACEQQLRQEPGTVSVKVSLKLVGNGTLVLRYNALVQSIGPVSDEWTMPNR